MKTGISGDPGITVQSFNLSDYLGRLMRTGCLQYLIWATTHISLKSLLWEKCRVSLLEIQLLKGNLTFD